MAFMPQFFIGLMSGTSIDSVDAVQKDSVVLVLRDATLTAAALEAGPWVGDSPGVERTMLVPNAAVSSGASAHLARRLDTQSS
jgi:1,6-anhydro-N-acetylmuramate kinase